MIETSNLSTSQLIVVDASFDQESFSPGKVYFLNTQKLGKEKQLVRRSDDRTFTIWEAISNTLKYRPESFFVFIDEAHRGMAVNQRDRNEAASIVQKFIVGKERELSPVPIIIGISAIQIALTNLFRVISASPTCNCSFRGCSSFRPLKGRHSTFLSYKKPTYRYNDAACCLPNHGMNSLNTGNNTVRLRMNLT